MYDAIVIGVGGMGSAALYHLARSGCKVLGLEQFDIPHPYGSSHGSTRIIRKAYSEGAEYVPLLRAAYRYWREIEEASGERILHVAGSLDIGPDGSRIVIGSKESCLSHGLEFEELDGAEVNRRYPGYRLPAGMRAIYQPNGGYVLSEAAITAHVATARALGADVISGARVTGWERKPKGIRVKTEAGNHEARRVVITAGPWIGSLSAALRTYCQPERQVMLWTEPLRKAEFEPVRFPVFNILAPFGCFYGFPNHGAEGFKIGKYHHLQQEVNHPDHLDRECGPEDETTLRQGIEEYFPQANGPTRRMAACLFTNSPDGHFILDRYPGEENVFAAAGFSGHGFKFCGVVGKILTEFCLDVEPSWDIRRFRITPERLAAKAPLAQSLRHSPKKV